MTNISKVIATSRVKEIPNIPYLIRVDAKFEILERLKKPLKKILLGLIASGALFSGSAKGEDKSAERAKRQELAQQIQTSYKQAHGWDLKVSVNANRPGETVIWITDKESKDEVRVHLYSDDKGKPTRMQLGTWAGEDRSLDPKMKEVLQEQFHMWKDIFPQAPIKLAK